MTGLDVICDYFSAPSDDAAASTIDRAGGPGASPSAPSQPVEDQPFDTVSTDGIDPVVMVATLEALVTGRDYEQVVVGPRWGHPLADRGEGERMVITVTDELQAALADADDGRLASVAVPWSQTDELQGHGDPHSLATLLHDMAELARRARRKHERMYCWTCYVQT